MPQTRLTTGLEHYFTSASYPLSINTRITRDIWLKNEPIFLIAKTTLSYRWMASLREPIHPAQVFSFGESSITKSEPQRGPRDLAFDDFGNGERFQTLCLMA